MGQKIHPTGLRVGINKNWKSFWYMPKEDYGDTVHIDHKIRKFIYKELKAAGIAKVSIKRFMNRVEIEIRVARPGVVIGRGGEQIEQIKNKINKIADMKAEVKVVEEKNPDVSARILANRIAEQLERRIVPKFAMSKELEKTKNKPNVQGVRIWVSGRIKGVEIARTEKMEWGTIPLHTLAKDIDYAFTEAQVPNAGKHGIKVWVCRKGKKRNIRRKERGDNNKN